MSILTRSQSKKDSIFEPRPYEYRKIKNDTNSNNTECIETINVDNTNTKIIKIIKMVCIIFSLIQIFITGLAITRNYMYLLSDSPTQILEIYVILWLLFIVYILTN
jgi:hypothetical protein